MPASMPAPTQSSGKSHLSHSPFLPHHTSQIAHDRLTILTAAMPSMNANTASMFSNAMPSASGAENTNYMSSNSMPGAGSATSHATAASVATGATSPGMLANSATISGPASTVTPFAGAAVQGKEVKAFAAAGVAVMVAAVLL